MKRRSLTVLLCLLAIISLASVGFASWVISAGDTEEVTGNIQVETVTDKRLVISGVSLSAENFIFTGKPQTTTVTNPWLKYDNSTTEVLSSVLSFNVAFKDKTTVTNGTNATITVKWDKSTEELLLGAVEEGYILAVPTLSLTGSEGEYSVNITFQWGTKFGGTAPTGEGDAGTAGSNPFDYFNKKEVAGVSHYEKEGEEVEAGTEGAVAITWADVAAETMKDLYEYFTEAGNDESSPRTLKSFKIIIDAQPKSN